MTTPNIVIKLRLTDDSMEDWELTPQEAYQLWAQLNQIFGHNQSVRIATKTMSELMDENT